MVFKMRFELICDSDARIKEPRTSVKMSAVGVGNVDTSGSNLSDRSRYDYCCFCFFFLVFLTTISSQTPNDSAVYESNTSERSRSERMSE